MRNYRRKRDPRACRHGRHKPRSLWHFLTGHMIGWMCLRCNRFTGDMLNWGYNPFVYRQGKRPKKLTYTPTETDFVNDNWWRNI